MNINSNVWGKKVIEKAMEYANYKWTVSEKNVMVSQRIENVAELLAKGYKIYRKC